MSKTRNFLTGALVGLSLAGTPTPVKAQKVEASKKDLKETLAAQGNFQEKAVDFQQVRKAGEEQVGNEPEILRTNKGLRDYLNIHDRIPPYLRNGTVVTGKQLVDSLFTADFNPMEDRIYSFIRSGENVILDLSDLPSNISISVSEGEWIKQQEVENQYLISKPLLLAIDNNDTGMFGFWAVDVGSKLRVKGGEVLGNDKILVISESGTGLREGEVGIQKNTELGAVEVEQGIQRLNYIAEDGLNHHLSFSDDPDEPLGNISVSVLLEYLKRDGAKLRIEEYNGVRDSIYEIGLECGSKHAYYPENINTPSWTIKVREIKEVVNYGTTVENYNSTHIEAPKYYSESSIVDKDSLEVGKTYQVRLKAKDGFEITKVIINGEEKTLGNGMVDFVAKKENTLSIDSKELLQYAAITESYDGNQVESPRYYEGEVEIHKEKLEIGKTYQVRLEAKDGFKITKVIINGEEKVLENGMVDFVVKKENTLEVQSEVTSGIEDKEIKKPRISLENGELTVDTQDSTIKTVQIYNLGGQLLHQRANLKGSESFVLNPGVYIVKYGLEAVKVVVK